MSRYIDAEVLCEALMTRWNIADQNAEKLISEVMADIVTPIVVSMPTADVVEVVRGEWIQHNEGVYQEKEKNWWHCSNCGNVIYSEHEDDRKEFHKWCGRCGAYMRGEENVEIH